MTVNIKALEGESLLTALLYGFPGAGKTSIAASVLDDPDTFGIPLFISFDSGLSAVAHRQGIRHTKIENQLDAMIIADQLMLPDSRRSTFGETDLRGVRTVIFDGVTSWRNKLVAQSALHSYRNPQGRKNPRTSPDQIELSDWGNASIIINNVITEFINRQKVHVILTTSVTEEENKDNEVVARYPDLNPKLQKDLEHAVSFVWYVARKKPENRYAVLTLPKDPYKIKHRLDEKAALPRMEAATKDGWYVIPKQDHPTIPYLYKLIFDK